MKIKTTVQEADKPVTVQTTEKKQPDRLTAMLLPSILGILLCMVCLCQMTWAWFSATQTSETAPIKSANYQITVTADDGTGAVSIVDQTATLTSGATYTVTLTASGTASTGFCILSYPASGEDGTAVTRHLYSAQIASGDSVSFTIRVEATADVTVTFSPQWGTSSHKDNPDISSGTALTITD